ncbi:MAG: Maf family nucleotide pyrophosphatase [Marinobacter sp.]|nr:Maf family nucleotide pyrophosphatase [Marinobacter sp.]
MPDAHLTPDLVLASSSPYRQQLLARLQLPFLCASPDIDESPLPGEKATDLVVRLAEAKARALASQYPGHLIIGSDQVASLENGDILTKPHQHSVACQQLARCSGQTVRFLTGLCLLDSATGEASTLAEPFDVSFRRLCEQEIEDYLRLEQPYDCAGSFRMEGLGITLFTAFSGRDPNSLIGLPLIALNDLLRAKGINPIRAAYLNSRRD